MQGKKVITAIILTLTLLFCSCSVQTPVEYYSSNSTEVNGIRATVSINCSTVLNNMDALDQELKNGGYIPKDGVVLPPTEYTVNSGDTAFDLLVKATKENKIQMEYQGADANQFSTIYIQGINNLYEFSCGELSGWMFKVNGTGATKGCNTYTLKDGDTVEWLYTCNLGRDVGCTISSGVE